MFGGVEMPNLDSDELQTQARHIWSMLDDMAANDPAAYRKFIDRQVKEGKEAMSPPTPHMCVQTSTYSPKQPLFINFCDWQRVPGPKSDEDPIPVIGGQLQRVEQNHSDGDKYQVVAVSFNPKVLEDFGRDARNSEERDALVNLAIDYLQDQHKLKISRQYKILPSDTPHKGSLENLQKSFKAKSSKDEEKFEKELDELEKTFGPMAAGAKDTVLNQLKNISLDKTDPPKPTPGNQPEIVLEPSKLNTPMKKGLIEEIGADTSDLDGHTCRCPVYKLTTEGGQLVMVVNLPAVRTVQDCELDISQDDISLNVPEKYQLCVKLPKKVFDEEARAKFNKKREQLTITMPIR